VIRDHRHCAAVNATAGPKIDKLRNKIGRNSIYVPRRAFTCGKVKQCESCVTTLSCLERSDEMVMKKQAARKRAPGSPPPLNHISSFRFANATAESRSVVTIDRSRTINRVPLRRRYLNPAMGWSTGRQGIGKRYQAVE
jgi:hypothetical protein